MLILTRSMSGAEVATNWAMRTGLLIRNLMARHERLCSLLSTS